MNYCHRLLQKCLIYIEKGTVFLSILDKILSSKVAELWFYLHTGSSFQHCL